ncbi:MAG: SDR family oxidoreductase [Kiloniellales bacterium]|nr:SDR family oxidoreductase [Kiloniellales bacterium]
MSKSTSESPVALIVGGGRGIGLAVGSALRDRAWRVVLADRDPLEPDLNDRFDCRQVDISDSPAVDRLAAGLLEDYGRVDGLVNAAGYNRHEAVSEIRDETWIDLFDVHLGGVLRVCRALYPALTVGPGAVVNFSSIGARLGRPRRAAYAAAKGGVEALTRTLAIEWAQDGIRVNTVVPGIIDTRMVQDNIAKGLVDADSLLRSIPMRRFGEAAEVAEAVTFLLCDQASYITGQTLVVDGGALANGAW